MNSRARNSMLPNRTPTGTGREQLKVVEREKEVKMDVSLQRKRSMIPRNAPGVQRSGRDRRIALKQDVDNLKKKLRHEENVHRALERALSRPLGTLPRLPPYLPPQILELLAEVAVLEEEVVKLEQQVVKYRWGLYQEAIYVSSSKKAKENAHEVRAGLSKLDQSNTTSQCVSSETSVLSCNDQSSSSQSSSGADHNCVSSSPLSNGKRLKKPNSLSDEQNGKENLLRSNSVNSGRLALQNKMSRITRTSNSKINFKETRVEKADIVGSNPNKLSEDLLRCFFIIFSNMSAIESQESSTNLVPPIPSFDGNSICSSSRDPYNISRLFGQRDIGPYRNLRSIDQKTVNHNLVKDSSPVRKLRLLLRKLESVDLRCLSHQEKLAFWINIYNSCMMNTFLEHGIPSSPQMVVTLMQEAVINVGGHLLSAMAIEHFILRFPFDSKHAFSKVSKNDEIAARCNFGLDWPEPMVTFALSCGSWSSPAVRVYTASQVEIQLENAKRDYLQAAIGISSNNKVAIPKLLDWYLLDFAKDMESLLDWICLQLPGGLRNDAVKCIERGKQGAFPSQNVQVLPYDFSFRYLLPL